MLHTLVGTGTRSWGCSSLTLSLAETATSILFCRDQSFVATNICLSRQSTFSVATKSLNFCHDKIVCRDKIMFVATNICSEKRFIATNLIFSRQKLSSRQGDFCRDKTRLLSFATTIILVATSASDSTRVRRPKSPTRD